MRSAVESGPGSRRRLGGVLQGLGARRVLLMMDQVLRRAGVAAELEGAVEADSRGVAIASAYKRVDQDARAGTVAEIAQAYQDADADGISAVGGGSVLDAAKAARWWLGWGLRDPPGTEGKPRRALAESRAHRDPVRRAADAGGHGDRGLACRRGAERGPRRQDERAQCLYRCGCRDTRRGHGRPPT